VTVLDTTVLVDHLRGTEAATRFLEEVAQPVCSEVTRVELTIGLRQAQAEAAEALFAFVDWVPVDERIARRAGALGRRYLRTHPGIGLADLVVAATAFELDQPLATSNTRHFPMFRRLSAPY
jgi:predicted nucleic acid-binding protein